MEAPCHRTVHQTKVILTALSHTTFLPFVMVHVETVRRSDRLKMLPQIRSHVTCGNSGERLYTVDFRGEALVMTRAEFLETCRGFRRVLVKYDQLHQKKKKGSVSISCIRGCFHIFVFVLFRFHCMDG